MRQHIKMMTKIQKKLKRRQLPPENDSIIVVSDWGLCTSAISIWEYKNILQQRWSDWPGITIKLTAKNIMTSGFKVMNRAMRPPGSNWMKVERDFDDYLSQIKQSFTHVGTCKQYRNTYFEILAWLHQRYCPGHRSSDPCRAGSSHSPRRRPTGPSQCSPRRAGPNYNPSINLWTTATSFPSECSHNTNHAGQALIKIHQSIYGPRPLDLHPTGPSQCSPRTAGPNHNPSINLWTMTTSFASNRAITMLTMQGRP